MDNNKKGGPAWLGGLALIAAIVIAYELNKKPDLQTVCKDNAISYIKNALERPETFNCTDIGPANVVNVKGENERVIHVKFNYRTKDADLKRIDGFVYLDTLGNVLRASDY